MYVKLFGSILDSSIWSSSLSTKILWVTMLAMADEEGIVDAAVPGLARRAGITVEQCEAGLAELLAPDLHSRTKEHEGRRIEEVDGGWLVLNHAKYREIQTKAQLTAAKRQKRYRASRAVTSDAPSRTVTRDSDSVTGVTSDAEPVTRHAESVTRNDRNATPASASTSSSVAADPEKQKSKETGVEKESAVDFDTRPFEKSFGDNAPLVIELVRSSHRQAAVAAAIWKHTLGSYNAGMAGAVVAHADVIGAAVQAYLANMKPEDVFVDRLFSGYVNDAIRRMGAGEQRERAKREDAHVDRERSDEEQRKREDAEIVSMIDDFARQHGDEYEEIVLRAEREIPASFKGAFRAPAVRGIVARLIRERAS